ncbi:MAG: AAA family ATPase [Pseudomonadota bacterium]
MTLVLIFGTSHAGKSTFARRLGAALGWPVRSTDRMGRHPGRPWPQVPPAVEEHYDRLSDAAILWFHRVHHENMRPLLRQRIDAALAAGTGTVLEGSALRPDLVAELCGARIRAVGLRAPDGVLRDRIAAESGWDGRPPDMRRRIDRFVARSLADGATIAAEAERLALSMVDTSDGAAVEAAFRALLADARGRV